MHMWAEPAKAVRRQRSVIAGRPLPRADSREGESLPVALQAGMEARLGHDFSGVRVHTGPDANQAVCEVGAAAFTRGDDIVLGPGADRPGSAGGDRLLRHELAHVVQQREASHVTGGVSAPEDAVERAAEAVAAGGAKAVAGSTVTAMQRQVAQGKEKQVATKADVQAALTDYLTRVMQEQGDQTLHISDQVKTAVMMLFKGNPIGMAQVQPWLGSAALPGSPAEFAAQVARFLPEAIPAENLSTLHGSVKQTPDRRPKTAGEAASAAVADPVVTPMVRGLKLPKDQQDKIIDAARSAVASGVVEIVDTVMGELGVAAGPQAGIHNAVEGLLKQQPGKAGDRQQEGAGSPYRNAQPPSVAPALPSAPGQHIVTTPPIKWDFPGVKPLPKPPRPEGTPDPQAQAAAARVDPNALIPADVRGTAQASGYADATEFARDLARKLDAAQKAKNPSVFMELGSEYANAKDRGAIYESARQIILAIRDALAHQASEVREVWLTIDGRQVFRVLLHP